MRRWNEFQQQSGLGEALRELPENPLPGVVLVTPLTKSTKPTLEALRQRLAELPKVQQAQLDLVWVERLAAILKLGDRFVFGLTVLVGVGIAFGHRQYHSSSHREPPHGDRGDQTGRRH